MDNYGLKGLGRERDGKSVREREMGWGKGTPFKTLPSVVRLFCGVDSFLESSDATEAVLGQQAELGYCRIAEWR